MRLNWNNLGKGLEGIADAKKARDLAQASARYDVTEGAYGPGLQENIQQLEGLRAGVADPAQNSYDPQQLAAYDQGIAELTRRQGLTAPDFSVASGAQNFGTRQEARQAAAPLRAEGLAGVYRRYGDVEKADALETRAFDQQRAIAREGREVQDFATRQAAAAQQSQLTGAKLTDIQRTQNLQAALDARLADINKQEFEKPEQRTQAILSLVEELQGPQAAAQLRANYTQQELNDISLQSKKFEEGYRQSRAKGVFSAMEWFDEQNAAFKLERDPKNPFRVIQVNQDGSRQLFADAKNERELGMIVDAKAKPGGWLELAKYDLDVKKAQDIADYYRARTQNERQRGGESEAQQAFQRKVDGVLEGYQTAVGLGPAGQQAAAIYAREYDQLRATAPKGLRAPPSLSALNQAQQPEKPVKVEEAGVQYKMGGKLMQTDGRGGLISAKGVLPDDRPAALKAAGVSDNDASRLMWSNDGDAVMFNNEEFDIRDKRDMKKLKEALEDYDVMQGRIAEEARLRGNPTSPSGFQGARTTGLGPASSFGVAPGAPSIYGR
jgi:hypothetical protein